MCYAEKCGEVCHVEKCWHTSPHFFVAKSVLLQFTLFCRKICFVAIYALLCGEILNQNLCLWRKKDKYQVWYRGGNFLGRWASFIQFVKILSSSQFWDISRHSERITNKYPIWGNPFKQQREIWRMISSNGNWSAPNSQVSMREKACNALWRNCFDDDDFSPLQP